MFGEDVHPSIEEKAAALLLTVNRNHALADGNKRLAWFVTVAFLELNGHDLVVTDVAAADRYSFTVDIPAEAPSDHEKELRAAGGATFKVSLVWSDPPGSLLQNDLDLVVIAADGSERHGNVGTADDFDRVNNVEQVLWVGMPPGQCTVVVRAFRITQFAQPYAYAWRIS